MTSAPSKTALENVQGRARSWSGHCGARTSIGNGVTAGETAPSSAAGAANFWPEFLARYSVSATSRIEATGP